MIPAVNGVRDGTGVPMIPGTNIPVAQVIDTPFNGIPRVYNPGVPANVNQAFGIGDGLQSLRQTVLPPQERYSVNFNGSYEVSEALNFLLNPSMRFQTTLRYRALTLTMAYPFVMTTLTYPALQKQITDLTALGIIPPDPMDGSFWGFSSSRDSDDLNVMPGDDVDRETVRIVAGVEGTLDILDGIEYELSYNYGSTDVETNNYNLRLEDRFYQRWTRSLIQRPVI